MEGNIAFMISKNLRTLTSFYQGNSSQYLIFLLVKLAHIVTMAEDGCPLHVMKTYWTM
jgi:hypothetical protein